MNTIEAMLNELIHKTETAVAALYQEKIREGCQIVNDLLKDMVALMSVVEDRDTANQLKEVVQQSLEVMKAEEYRLLADILQLGVLGNPVEIAAQVEAADNCYEENFLLLERCCGKEACEKYRKWQLENKEQQASAVTVTADRALDGSWIIEIKQGEKSYFVNSAAFPQKEAELWSQQFNFNYLSQPVFLFGLGNTMLAEKLCEKGNEDMSLVIYEPSLEIFDFLMHNADLSGLLGRENITLLVDGLNEEALYGKFMEIVTFENRDAALFLLHKGYADIFPEEYKAYDKRIRDEILLIIQCYNTKKRFRTDIVYNMTSLWSCMKRVQFLGQYIGKFPENVPAIVVAAGPSLDYNVEILKKAKGKAVIVATDKAMPTLVKHQIKPDFIATIDAQKAAPEFVGGEFGRNIPLFCDDTSSGELLKYHRGPKIVCSLHSWMEGLRPEGIPKEKYSGSGGSVATEAYKTCCELGFKTIILIGQDLAYRDGVSHAGNIYDDGIIDEEWRVEDIYGNMIQSRPDWVTFLNWYEDSLKKRENSITLIDATEGGAKIHGSRIMTLEEAVSKYCSEEVDCESLIAPIPFIYEGENYKKVMEYVKNIIDELETIERETKELIQKNKEIISLCKKGKHDKKYKQLVEDLSKLGDRVIKRPVHELIDIWISDKEEDIEGLYSLKEDSEEKSYQIAMEIYKNLNEATREIKPILTEAYENMKLEL